MKIRFNVFGKKMSVQRKQGQWLLFNESDTGIASRVYDVVIPDSLEEIQLEQYLDDIYHEYSSEQHSQVERLS